MSKVDKAIEYLFYLLVLLYFVGKVFKPITFFIDVLFIYAILKDQNKKQYILELYKKYKNFFVAVFIFVGYLLFQSVFLEEKYNTFKSSFETILYLILVFAAIYNFNDIKKVKKLIFVSYAILFFLALDSFYQYFTGFDFFGQETYNEGKRLTAWSHAPKVNVMMGQFFGLLIATVFLFKGREKKLAIFMLVISLVLFILSGNRSPLVALFPMIFIVFLFTNKKKYLLGFLGIIFVTTVFIFTNPKLSNEYSVFTKSISNKTTSGRLVLYDAGLKIIEDNPIFGIGSGNYRYYFKDAFEKIDKSKHEDFFIKWFEKKPPPHVHSVFLDMIISYGIVGCILFIYLLYQIYRFFIKNNEIGLIASIGFLYCITPLQFSRTFTMGDWQFITYLGLIFLIVLSNYKKLEYESNNLKRL